MEIRISSTGIGERLKTYLKHLEQIPLTGYTGDYIYHIEITTIEYFHYFLETIQEFEPEKVMYVDPITERDIRIFLISFDK